MNSASPVRYVKPKLTSYRFIERSRCPACRSNNWTSLHRQSFGAPPVSTFIAAHYGVDAAVLGDAEYDLAECQSCTLVFQRWIGDEELLSEIYGIWVHEHGLPTEEMIYKTEIGHPLQSRDAHEIMTAASFLGVPLKELTTLDYGMGWALWARIVRTLGCQSFGNDIVQRRMEFAREHGVTPVTDEDLGTPRYHFINTEQVMEHLVDPAGVSELLAASLLPGGILKISVPSGERSRDLAIGLSKGRGGDFSDKLVPLHPLEHVNSFTGKSLHRLASKLGLKIVRPSLAKRYAFAFRRGTLSPRRPAKAFKELIRPVYQWRNQANLYVWMRKPAA